jgi:type I restriction enzyme M protein
VRTKETADLFLVLIKHILKVNGRAALVLPDGTLFGEGVKTRIKEQLLAECNLHTIVRLPNGVFAPYTGIKTNLLFFTKGTPTRARLVLRAPVPAGREELQQDQAHPHRGIRRRESLVGQRGRWLCRRVENERAWKVSIEQIKAASYNLDQKNPHVGEQTSHDPEQLLADYARLQGEAQALRDELKKILAQSLSSQR